MTLLWALFPQAVFIPRQKSVHATVKIHSRTLHSEVSTLIDSGATESFLSQELVDHFSIPTYSLSKPRTIRNIDGTKNKIGSVTAAADLDIKHNSITTTHTFYVIELGDDYMLLGMPFLAATNPDIDWSTGQFKDTVIAATMDAYKWTPRQDSKVYKPFYKGDILPGYRHFERLDEPLHMINIEPDDYTFIRRLTKATELAAEAADTVECSWQEQVPAEYHCYGKVFSNEEAQRFPAP